MEIFLRAGARGFRWTLHPLEGCCKRRARFTFVNQLKECEMRAFLGLLRALAAGVAAAQNYEQQSVNEHREYGGNVYEYKTDGIFSYSPGTPGAPCTDDICTHTPNPAAIPDGTDLTALYHTHPGTTYDDGTEVSIDDELTAIQYQVPEFVGTQPDGRVVMFDINRFNAWQAGAASSPTYAIAGSLLGLPRF